MSFRCLQLGSKGAEPPLRIFSGYAPNFRVVLFSKLRSYLVWLDAPLREESEYILGIHLRPCFSVETWRNLFMSNFRINRFSAYIDFFHFQYFGLISVKTKAFEKHFFINILRILSSTNPEIFIEIRHHFGIGGWDPMETANQFLQMTCEK